MGVGESIRGIHPPLVVRVHPRLRRSSILILELELDRLNEAEFHHTHSQNGEISCREKNTQERRRRRRRRRRRDESWE